MSARCGCEGVQAPTPKPTANPPASASLNYRVGTHATFLASMLARLSAIEIDVPDEDPQKPPRHVRPLASLATRAVDDPAIALLDAWAVVADILTFYQERLANEGYLRTATERRSVLELARLIGYRPRPGVAASVHPAYTLQDTYRMTIPAGSSVQSVPIRPDESPQIYETSEALDARADWNQLKVRVTRPHLAVDLTSKNVVLQGTANRVQTNDPLLVDVGTTQLLYRVMSVATDTAADLTTVSIQPWHPPSAPAPAVAAPVPAAAVPGVSAGSQKSGLSLLGDLLTPGRPGGASPLETAPSVPPADVTKLQRSASGAFAQDSDALVRLVAAMRPAVGAALYDAWQAVPASPSSPMRVYALRVQASPFGSNAALKPVFTPGSVTPRYEEWPLNRATATGSETFAISLDFSLESVANDGVQQRSVSLSGTIEVGGTSTTSQTIKATIPKHSVTPGRIDSDTQDVFITVTVPDGPPLPGTPLSSFHLVFNIGSRPIEVSFDLAQAPAPPLSPAASRDQSRTFIAIVATVVSKGSNPTTVAISGLGPNVTISGSLPVPTDFEATEDDHLISLDAVYDRITPGGWVVVDRPSTMAGAARLSIWPVDKVQRVSRADYGLIGAVTQLDLGTNGWLADGLTSKVEVKDLSLSVLRATTVYAQSERLPLGGQPIDETVHGTSIELASLYDGLDVGRLIIVFGPRADLAGVTAGEVAMISGVTQTYDPALPDEKVHTTLQLANALNFTYQREAVTVYGNVVHATHGDTRIETLGGGDPARAFQEFTLKEQPLTHVSAATPTGESSTLQVRVSDLLWHEASSWIGLGPRDRNYTTSVSDDDRTTVVFGDGRIGARPAAGSDNVKSVYRIGIGGSGNVAAGQISLLGSRPLGVIGVINPLAATGGADRDSRDSIRANAPLTVTALDRLVSVQDYTDFSRTFAGVGKASATWIVDGHTSLIHVTVAGVDDSPIGPDSDLLQHLREALFELGDPNLAVRTDVRVVSLLIISARVKVLADYAWPAIKPVVERALYTRFAFDQRDFGQPAFLSEAVSAMQGVTGVDEVEVDVFDGVPETIDVDTLASLGATLRLRPSVGADPASMDDGQIQPARLVFLDPGQPATLLLSEIES